MVYVNVNETEIPSVFAHYRDDMRTIRQLHESGEDAGSIIREITDATDTFILRLFLHHLRTIMRSDEPPPHLILLAQGGYGRRELHPKSDIDILFLHTKPLEERDERLVKAAIQSLFDLGFVVGNAIRTFREAIDIAQRDIEIQTAISESRFLLGDWRVFEEFKHEFWRGLRKNRHDYIRRKIAERESRLKRHGFTLNITEPHIKESPGGLRDYHFGLWLGSLAECRTMNLTQLKRHRLIDDLMAMRVQNALNFLWRVRTDLHFHHEREQDVLVMPIQHDLSMRLGYRDRQGRLAEEEMMRDYYRHALTLRQFADHMIRVSNPKPFWSFLQVTKKKNLPDGFYIKNNQLFIPPNIYFYEHYPQRLVQTFIHAAENNAPLAGETLNAIHDNLDLVDQAFLHDKNVTALIRKFFALPQGIERSLREMRKSGFLERMFPEWKTIQFLVRHDMVHRYTVDEHSLLCLYHLENLLEDDFQFAQERFTLWYNCAERDVLRLAVLFHDIGKGKEGDHSIVGARMADTIARRLRMPETKRKMLVFLVENHLIMSHTAQHRDLSDPLVVTEFSDGLDRFEHLNLLYLLTYVDMRSVSPDSMTEWKNNLLWQLYLATRAFYIAREGDGDGDAGEDGGKPREVSRIEKLVKSLSAKFDPVTVRQHLDNLPASYHSTLTETQIRQHLSCVSAYGGSKPVTRFYPHHDPCCREMIIVWRDKVGLFHRICAAVALENFSIQEARLNTRKDGVVVNNIVIRDAIDGKEISEDRQELLRERIERLLSRDESDPPPPPRRRKKPMGRSSAKDSVRFLNDASTRFTVLEIRCNDVYGLLQDLTGIISSRNANIHFARIITEGTRVTDVMYLTGPEGDKIYDRDMLNGLREALVRYIEQET